jgi:NRPS condensation-like uncharacterized protein
MRWSRVWNFYGRRPAPLNGSNPPVPATPSTACPSYVSRRLPFDRDGWSNRKRRLSINATLNDVLLAAVFRAVGQWNERASIRPAQSWIRLAVPIDLASSDDRRAVLANYVGIVFVDRRSDRIRQHAELLAGIHEEMQSIKQQGLGFAMLDVLRILERIPYGMRAAVAPTRSMSTAVVSNLGPLDALLPHDRDLTLGRARLMEFDFLVPIRPGTAAAFGIVTYADQLHLAMNYDQQRLTANDAASLADLVCALLKDSLRPARNECALAGERQFA